MHIKVRGTTNLFSGLVFIALLSILSYETHGQCTLFNVSGGGSVCAGLPGVTITLSQSQIGRTYQLKNGTLDVGVAKAGTGSALTWTNNTLAGTYTVTATKTTAPTCTATMTGNAIITVNPLPILFTVSGTGAICSGSTGLTVTLSGSQSGINYQLKNGAVSVGTTKAGTGLPLTWTNISTAGTYTIVATNSTTGCIVTMTGNALITVNPLPTIFALSGTGTICSGATGLTVTLNGSQSGVNYQLKNGSANVGASKAGTGSALTWTNNFTAGNYTVAATNATTTCTATMNGSAVITVNPLPTTFTVSGTGSICTGAAGLTITLSGSQSGVNYQLKNGAANVGATKPGTGSALTWTNNSTAGTYTIVASNPTTSCTSTMTGSAVISINPLPTLFTVSGTGTMCQGSVGLPITLSGSQTGVNYQLKNGSADVGTALAGTGTSLTWTNMATSGIYTVVATNATTGCTATMSSIAVIIVLPAPTAFTVTGTGAICSGDAGLTVTLSGSQVGVNYQLKNGAVNVGAVKAGTNQALIWPNNITAGTYTVVATNSLTACTATMAGSAIITVNALPAAFTIGGGGSFCSGGTGVPVTLSNSTIGINYQLKVGAANSGLPQPGTGSPLTFSNNSIAGNYSVVAINATTTCTSSMTGSVTVTPVTPPTIMTTTGGNVCEPASVTVGLSGSQNNVDYQLQINGVNMGASKSGTGGALTWGIQSAVGIYTVIATVRGTSCNLPMSGNAVVNALPTVFAISGGGTLCFGDPGVTVTQSGSQTGITYQLQLNGVNTGTPVAGTNNALNWNGLIPGGTYHVNAMSVAGCGIPMTGEATVTVNPLPTTYDVAGGGSLCSAPGVGLPITLSGSVTGVNYQLNVDNLASGASQPGTGSQLTWSGQSTMGMYSVTAIITSTGCKQAMTGNTSIIADSVCSALNNFAFLYKYDSRNRMTHKKIPGTDWVYMVYDDRDRLVLTQDGNQRLNNRWTFTKYDVLNRPVMTGIYTHSALVNQDQMQAVVNSYYDPTTMTSAQTWFESFSATAGNIHNYDNKSFPQVTDLDSYLTVTYYDDNTTVNSLWGSNYNYATDNLTSGTYSQPSTDFRSVIGHPVATKTKLIDESNTWLKSILFYDDHYRIIQNIADNVKGGTDRVSNLYDFTGRALTTKTTHHTSAPNDQIVARNFDYDHIGRLLRTWHSVNNATPVLLTANDYNEIGQLVTKKLYSTDGSTFKQNVDHRYNIRGWLTNINNSTLANDGVTNSDTNDLFGMDLLYNETDSGLGNNSMYNGNISAVKWSNNLALGTTKNVAYNYSYDPMNRITSASYLTNNAGWSNATNAYNETGYAYDLNGNIKNMVRNNSSGTAMDNLNYTYNGNQLLSVTDTGDKTKGFIDGPNNGNDYDYDANGNMKYDLNKNLGASLTDQTHFISYNHLNLPSQVVKNTGEKIIYTYDAGGRKLRQQVYNAGGTLIKTTDYVGEYIYQNDTLQFINHEEGRIVMKGVTNPEYQYHLKDHLGNVRLTFTSQITTRKFEAGFEEANQTTEASNFTNYQANKINTLTPTNPNATTGNSAYYLNGGYAGQVGLAKSFSVMPGDVVSIQASAKYSSPSTTPTDFAPFIGSLLAAFNLSAPAPGEVCTPAVGVNTFGNWEIGPTGDESKDDAMKIFVTIIMFDKNYNFLDVAYQAIQGSGSMNATYKATQPGYAYLYISNEHPYLTDVYFDDVTVTFTPSLVVQQEDFYPFGLAFNSYTRENSVMQNFLYNGKELQNDLSLGWYDYGARMYMPEIGRWPKIDPKAELYFQITPYAYAANTPTNAIDPDGRLVIFINGQHDGTGGKVDYWQKRDYVTRYSSYSFLGQTVWSGNETRMEVTQDFAGEVQDHFNDHSPARFYDGALGGWSNTIRDPNSNLVPDDGSPSNLSSLNRYNAGLSQGEHDAADIIRSLDRTGGTLESIKVVSHSMGGAYAKGFVQAIVNYAMAHPEECRGLKISEFDFDPLQAAHLRAIAGVHTEQDTHIGGLADGKQEGLEDAQGVKDGNKYREDPSNTSHSIMSFWNQIQKLSEGTYIFVNGQFVKQ